MFSLRISIPAVTYEKDYWVAEDDGMSSRRQRSQASGEYQSAVPPMISEQKIQLPTQAMADVEEAATALIRFDAYAQDKLGLGSPTLGPMSSVLLRTESTSSSQIENLTVGARALALAELNQSSSVNAGTVVANVHAMEAALALADELNADAILSMHHRLLSGQRGWEEHAGRFRDQLVWVGSSSLSPRHASFVAPQAERVTELIEDVVAFMAREDLPYVVQAAISHAQFETIHPFVDGNGRVGRALVHAFLRAKSVVRTTTTPISAGLLKNTQRYFAALNAYRAGDAGPIVEEFCRASRFAASSGRTLVDELATELDEASKRMAGLRPQATAWAVLPHLISHPVINTELTATLLQVSNTTALRALGQLENYGVLIERSGFKRNRVWQHDGILAVLDHYAAQLVRTH